MVLSARPFLHLVIFNVYSFLSLFIHQRNFHSVEPPLDPELSPKDNPSLTSFRETKNMKTLPTSFYRDAVAAWIDISPLWFKFESLSFNRCLCKENWDSKFCEAFAISFPSLHFSLTFEELWETFSIKEFQNRLPFLRQMRQKLFHRWTVILFNSLTRTTTLRIPSRLKQKFVRKSSTLLAQGGSCERKTGN